MRINKKDSVLRKQFSGDMVSAKPRLLSDFASGGGGVWGGILRLLHPFLLAKFGADTHILYYITILFQKTIKVIIQYVNKSSKKLGENIKKIRLAKGMTQGDLCRRLEVDRAYMSNIESGKKNPTLSTIENIAKALNVSVDELLK
jgi:DNA-binding XRE family transcriptional regulator